MYQKSMLISKIKKEDYKKVKEYYNSSYPDYIFYIDLYHYAEYVNGLCSWFLAKRKELKFKIIELTNDEKNDINKRIESVYKMDKEKVLYLRKYYEMTLEAVEILKKYYKS